MFIAMSVWMNFGRNEVRIAKVRKLINIIVKVRKDRNIRGGT